MNEKIIDNVKEALALFESSEVCNAEYLKTKALLDKLEKDDMTISVIGQFKRGKSTLVNAILGEEILPVGIVPVTSVVTCITYGKRHSRVHFENGVIQPVEMEDLHKYVNEQENPNNKYGVSSVHVQTESDFLKSGITFVDTPGVGSVHKHNSDAAYAFVKESDAVIFAISVDSPINEIEISFLKKAKEFAAKFYFIANKIDYIDEDELKDYLEYCSNLLCGILEVDSVILMPVSAKKHKGIEELKERILYDCQNSVKDILQDSAAMKLKDIVRSARSRLDLYWNALRLPVGKLETRFALMREALEKIQEESKESVKEYENITGSERYAEIAAKLDIKINEMKMELTKQVSELFGMEYDYELAELNMAEKYVFSNAPDNVAELVDRFIRESELICKELTETLDLILMYREKNTITVVRRVEDLNKLNRKLRSLTAKL